MAEILEKLRPDRDLQCYFERPSAVAALSAASATGFTVSGCWRQQFDWAVLEWNRDNVFEHPSFRNLPDGDLSGLSLAYEETRDNCIPMDSDLYPGVWSYLRVWVDGEVEPRMVRLRDHATAVEGAYGQSSAMLQLGGTPTAGDYIGLSWFSEQYNYQLTGSDTIESAAAALAGIIDSFSTTMRADATAGRITLSWQTAGVNGNRVGAYGFVAGARTEFWTPWWAQFSGGTSPVKWRVELDFGSLTDTGGAAIPTAAVRKMRWTWQAELQAGGFARSEFEVVVSNWAVSGSNRGYVVAGRSSRRIEDDSGEVSYTGTWERALGNFSGGTMHWTGAAGSSVTCSYQSSGAHRLYLGTRRTDGGGQVTVTVDGTPVTLDLRIAGEDALVRVALGERGAGNHTVTAESLGGGAFWFDFVEIAVAAAALPEIGPDGKVSLATDWDTDHSMALAPERTAWLIRSLGFGGRVNHYVGALWFYELVRQGHVYASAMLELVGTPQFGPGEKTEVTLGRTDDPGDVTVLTHLHRIGDTAETVAKALEQEINRGYMSMRAEAVGNLLTIDARAMGEEGNKITVAAWPASGDYRVEVSGAALSGGTNGEWRTDLAALPRLNRAARDWSRSFFGALAGYGMQATAALSLELQHGDPSVEAGIAQRCPAGDAVLLTTPALQTNFSPASLAFWRQAYLELAELMVEAGLEPYLQFGEVQWWYFRNERSGMPYYDDWTQAQFLALYGRAMDVITENIALPAEHPQEAAFLAAVVGGFTAAVQEFVRAAVPGCRFEALYPVDVNDTEWNRVVNYPAGWTPAALDCLKTESFTHTYSRNLDRAGESIAFGGEFPPHQRAHLVGISYPTTPWQKEVRLARAAGLESVVLFALDQFCLIGYGAPLPLGARRAVRQG